MPNQLAVVMLGAGWVAAIATGDASLGLCFIATVIAINGQLAHQKGKRK